MTLPFTSIVGYHMNPLTCGVAKFNAELAKRLDVPFVGLDGPWGHHPLLSLKASEFAADGRSSLVGRVMKQGISGCASFFWHDAGLKFYEEHATHVFYADRALGSPALWCPSLIAPKKRTVKLFTFGMAHKLQPEYYRKVKSLLDTADQPYHLRVSVGLHEGTSLDGAGKHFDALTEILGPENVTILGILSDDAVSEELAHADYVLAFFEHGARANNTTIHAALEAGCGVITNHDKNTPLFFDQTTKDIHELTTWPSLPGVYRTPYGWNELLLEMERICEASRSATAR